MQKLTHKTSIIKSKTANHIPLGLSLSSTGHLYLYPDAEASQSLSKSIAEKINSFFSISESVGLLRLGLTNFGTVLPISFTFWQLS